MKIGLKNFLKIKKNKIYIIKTNKKEIGYIRLQKKRNAPPPPPPPQIILGFA